MKRRLLAFALAFTMTFSSFFTVNAEEEAALSQESLDTSVEEIAANDDLSDEGLENQDSDAADEGLENQDSDAADESLENQDSDVTEASDDSLDSENADATTAEAEDESTENDSALISSDGSSDSVVEEVTESSDGDTEKTTDDGDSDIKLEEDKMVQVTNWKTGITGGKDNIKVNSVDNVTATSPGANGKWSSGEDSFGYYAPTDGVDITKDFVFTATMNIDNLLPTAASNPAQSSAGILVMAPIMKTPPSVSLGIAMADNNSGYIGANTRGAFNEKGEFKPETRIDASKDGNTYVKLSDKFSGGANRGTFDLKIEKIGYVYIVSCGDQKVKYDFAKENFMGSDGKNTLIYPAIYSARDVNATFSNIKLMVDEREAVELKVINDAADRTALAGNEPALDGLKLAVVYSDGTERELEEGYSIKGYDKNLVGKQMAKLVVGEVSLDYEIEILKKTCTEIKIESYPMKTSYYEGQYLRTDNLVVKASYNDGNKDVLLERDEYEILIKGKVIGENDFITADLAGSDLDFVIRRKETADIGSGSAKASFKGSVSPYKLSYIKVLSKPAKTVYYINEKQNVEGLSVKGYYTSSDGQTTKSDYLQESEYTVSNNLDTSKVQSQKITVTSKFNPKLTDSFTVNVQKKIFIKAYISSYPRTTYPELREDPSNYDPKKWYDYYNGNDDGVLGTKEDGTEQYNKGRVEITYLYSDGNEVVAPSSEYEINLDEFDIRESRDKSKPNQIKIVFPESSEAYGTEPIILPITVRSEAEYGKNYWKPIIFGASSSGTASEPYNTDEPTKNKMGIIFKHADGKEVKFDTRQNGNVYDKNNNPIKDKFEVTSSTTSTVDGKKVFNPIKSYTGEENIEEKGSSVRLWALSGAGKIADSNDGEAFYYTRLSAKDNFRLSADFYVHSYINGDNDEVRDGQEGFGIMARDIISLIPDPDIENNIRIVGEKEKAAIQFEYDTSKALKDKNGEPEPYSTSIYNYSNAVFIGGHSGSGWPKDPNHANYEFDTKKNRINLIYRTFIKDTPYDASPEVYRSSVKKTLSQDFPSPGSRYHIVLERLSGGTNESGDQLYPSGYKGVCYDYQTGEFRTDFVSYDEESGETDLTVLDPDNIYVGFFASRYADVTVSNVNLVKSDPATDMKPLVVEGTRATVPKLYLKSSIYSTTTDYKLILRTSNNSGGKVTIQQDGKVIFQDAMIQKKETIYPVKLKENSTNVFTVKYDPGYLPESSLQYQEISSYDPVYYTYEISHKGNFDTSKKFIYVAPDEQIEEAKKTNNKLEETGDITDPMKFDVALGLMQRGQTMILLPGVYYKNTKTIIEETSAGTKEKRKAIVGYNKYQAEEEGYAVSGVDVPDGDAIFDLQNKDNGFENHADNWTFKNFHIRNGGKNAKPFHTGADNGLIENIKIYDCQDSGMCVSRTSSDQLTVQDWPTNNLLKNCEVWNCADTSHNNADGYAIKLTVGYGNKLVGCVSHHNADDGWDLFCKQSGGYMAPVTLDGCITYKGGYRLQDDGTSTLWDQTRGGRNGFKMGGDNMDVNNVLINCIAFENGNSGITSNSNPLMTIRNTVAYNNQGSNFSLYSGSNTVDCFYNVKGIVSYKPQSGAANGGDSITNYGSTSQAVRDKDRNIVKDENGNIVREPIESFEQDYNYIKRSDQPGSMNASGTDMVTDDFFVSLKSPVVDGHIPQDLKTGEFQLNGFLQLTDEVKNKIKSVEGYDEIIEQTTTKTDETTEDSVVIKGTFGGGGSSKRSNSSKTSSTSSSNKENNNANNSNTGNTNSENSNTENTNSENSNNNNGNLNTTNNNITVSAESENGAKVEVSAALAGKVSIAPSSDFNGNAAKVEFANGADLRKLPAWVEIPFSGDTSNPDNIVVSFVDENGNKKIIKAGYYDAEKGKAFAPAMGSGTYGAELVNVSFSDMTGNWAKPYVEALAARGIVNGVNQNTFAPNAKIKRGDFVLMLSQVVDISSDKDSGFSDVSSSDYYSKAIAAAREEGLVKGISDSVFGAKENISRQDVMTIIARTLEKANVKLDSADISKFSDSTNVSDYAKDSVCKLVGSGIISGNNGAINPKDNLTRAEAAKILYEVWKRF